MLKHIVEYSIGHTAAAQQFAGWLLEVGEGKGNQENKIILPSSMPPLN
jgi:hypothetical protein